jgi:hypothetical protein
LLIVGLIGAFAASLRLLPSRYPLPAATVALLAEPVDSRSWKFDGVALAGAWSLRSPDPRFGGVSALAVDRGALVGLTDSGVTIRFAPPVASRARLPARIADLPAGPGDPSRKSNRDSEALLADAAGWWVAFENRHGLWRFAPGFTDGRPAIDLEGQGFPLNQGIEGLARLGDGRLLAFPEAGGEMLVVEPNGSRVQRIAVDMLGDGIGDAVALPDGRILILRRPFGAGGFAPELDLLVHGRTGWSASLLARIGLGPFDNPEAIAAAPLVNGATRLWIMTDNDFRAGTRTLLVALDLPAAGGRRAPNR